MLEMIKDDLDTIRALAPLVSAVVGGMGAFAAILNFKNRVLAFLHSRRKTKLSRAMSEWWVLVYDSLVASHSDDGLGKEWGESEFNELTVLEACAWTNFPLPKWAVNGVEKKKLKEFTQAERL